MTTKLCVCHPCKISSELTEEQLKEVQRGCSEKTGCEGCAFRTKGEHESASFILKKMSYEELISDDGRST